MTRLFKKQCSDPELRRLAFRLLAKHFEDGRPAANLLSTSDRRVILEFFRTSNEKFFREYFSSENKFAPELLLTGKEIDREVLTIEDTTKIIVDLVKRQREMEIQKPIERRSSALRWLDSILGR